MNTFIINTLIVVALVSVLAAVIVFFKRQKDQEINGLKMASERAKLKTVATPSNNASQGIKAFMKGHYKEAFRILEPAAHDDNLRAQKLVAKMYFAGNGVRTDQKQYLYWLRRAAENGDKPSKIKVKKIEANSD